MARIAFFGTPDFSVPFLSTVDAFCRQTNHELVLVVTQLEKPQGRGQRVQRSPIYDLAEKLNLTIAQPSTLKKGTEDGDAFFELFSSLSIDLAIVVAYGKIISERLLRKATKGFVNVHASLLPRFRGAAPIQRAIEAGDHETGVCLMDMVRGLDEGDVFACKKTPIIASDTSATLFRRLSRLGSLMLSESLNDLIEQKLGKTPQKNDDVIYAHMLYKSHGLLDFSQEGALLCRQVRAFDPWPATYGFIRNKRVKFFDSFFIADTHNQVKVAPGTIVTADVFLGVKTIDGIVYFQRLQVEGKNILPIKQALLGFPIKRGEQILPGEISAKNLTT